VSDFAARHPWAVRAVVASGCIALLASSEQESGGEFSFRRDLPPTTTELSTDITTRVYRVDIRVLGTAEGLSTTSGATAIVRGTVNAEGITQGTPAPYVAYAAYLPDGGGQRVPAHTLDDFELTLPLWFTGDCSSFSPSSPCTASFVVDLSRADDGMNGGTVTVDWSLHFRVETSYSEDAPKSQELPWEVSVEEL
jgi:hypothetical protein